MSETVSEPMTGSIAATTQAGTTASAAAPTTDAAPKPAAGAELAAIFQIEIALLDVEPDVHRTIEIPGATTLTVTALTTAEPGVRYPRCTAGHNACPPEDVGEVFGYAEFLQTTAADLYRPSPGLRPGP